MKPTRHYDAACTQCPRLAGFLEALREEHPDYHNLPVPPFGDEDARLLIVGLAPGMHGANASGRPFTGDYAGELLYETLHRFGFANRARSVHRDDGLRLIGCRITNAVKCLPPKNRPAGEEIRSCNRFLQSELADLPPSAVIIALGTIAHNAVLRALGLKQSQWKFGHGKEHALPGRRLLIDSYHCSRYNTNTRRLTPDMFDAVFVQARDALAHRFRGAHA